MNHLFSRFKWTSTYQSILEISSSNIIRAGIGFLGSIIIFRNFSQEDIANIYVLMSLMLILQQLADLGLTPAYVRLGAPLVQNSNPSSHMELSQLSTGVFLVKLIIAVISVTCVGGLFVHITQGLLFESGGWYSAIFLTCLGAAAAIIASVASSYLELKQRFRSVALFKTIPVAIKTLVIGACALFAYKSFNALIACFLLLPICSLLLGVFYFDWSLITLKFEAKKTFKKIYSFSMWLSLASLAGTLFSQIDVLMLKKLSQNMEVANFVGAQRIAGVFLLFSQALFTVLLPKVSTFNNKTQLMKFWKMSLLLLPMSLPFLFIVYFFADPLVPLLLGEKYRASIDVFTVLCLQYVFITLCSTLSLIYFNRNKVYVLALLAILQLALNYYFNLLAIPSYGALGAAGASCLLNFCFFSVYVVLTYLEIRKIPGNKPQGS